MSNKLSAKKPVKARKVKGFTVVAPPKSRRKWTEQELLKGVTPALCRPDLIPDRRGNELI